MKRNTPTYFIIKSWYKLYVLAIFCCLPFIFNFLWGNHDWGWIKEYTPLTSGLFEGRFSQFIIPILLFSGNILPVFSLMTGLAFLSLAAVLTLNLWQTPKKNYIYLLLGLNIIIAPYTISWFYFAFLTLSCLTWPVIIIAGFIALATNSFKKTYTIPLATLLFSLALGGYPPVINMIGVILFTLIINDIYQNEITIKKYIPHAIAIIGAIAILLIIQHFLKLHHWQYDTYNTAHIDLNNLKDKFSLCFKTSFKQLTRTTSFISCFYKYTTLSLCLIALWELWQKISKKPLNIICLILSLCGLLLSTTLTLFAAENTVYVIYEPRIDFYSLPYIYTFAGSIIFRSKIKFIKNITLSALFLVCLYNLNTITYAQKVWTFGFKTETAMMERIINRLEDHPQFSPYRNYTFAQSGSLNFRQKYYQLKSNETIDSYTLFAPYIPWQKPSKAFTFYYPQTFINNDFDIFWWFVSKESLPITPEFKQYIYKKSAPWPHKNSLYVDSSLIALTLTSDGENMARQWFDKNISRGNTK